MFYNNFSCSPMFTASQKIAKVIFWDARALFFTAECLSQCQTNSAKVRTILLRQQKFWKLMISNEELKTEQDWLPINCAISNQSPQHLHPKPRRQMNCTMTFKYWLKQTVSHIPQFYFTSNSLQPVHLVKGLAANNFLTTLKATELNRSTQLEAQLTYLLITDHVPRVTTWQHGSSFEPGT